MEPGICWKEQPVAATALALPTTFTNANGLPIKCLPITNTKCPILSQFAKYSIMTGIQVAYLTVVLITIFAVIAALIPK